jgi:hypothetical protein
MASLIDTLFPEDIDKNELINEFYRDATQSLYRFLKLRYMTAITGAMRWDNSQEAPIDVEREISVNFLTIA